MGISLTHLTGYSDEENGFLNFIVMSDETHLHFGHLNSNVRVCYENIIVISCRESQANIILRKNQWLLGLLEGAVSVKTHEHLQLNLRERDWRRKRQLIC